MGFVMKTRQWALTGLFTALIAICSQIQIPLPMIPLNLALLAIFLSGSLLKKPYGVWAVLGYILLGLVGLPVFAGFRGGAAALLDKTGGYIVGYLPCVLVVSLYDRKENAPFWSLPLMCVLGTLALYSLGTLWFMRLTGLSLWLSLSYCVFPFLIGDGLKILLACILTQRLRPALKWG